MSSERAGTPTHGRLDREQALPVIEYARNLPLAPADAILDRLEACVVQAPRLARIEALIEEWQDGCDEWAAFHPKEPQNPALRSLLDELRTALRGNE